MVCVARRSREWSSGPGAIGLGGLSGEVGFVRA
jgi:hypothetical protein